MTLRTANQDRAMETRWPAEKSRSQGLYDRALKVLPGGITRTLAWQDPFPIYAKRARGAYVEDVDGEKRLDLVNNFGSLIHGHAHPSVTRAVKDQVESGTAFSFPTEQEIKLAECLCYRAETIDQVRFCNSGSEAVMSAIKAARAFTGRPKIVKCEGVYHGAYDYAEVSLDSTPSNWGHEPRSIGYSRGVPPGVLDDVIVVPFNDVAATERIIRANFSSIAAVLVDPAPSYSGFVAASPAFVEMIQRVCREIEALLILDEVITFRAHLGGAQSLLGIRPDLTVLAKIIGGGFPVGAVAGRREVMQVYDHRSGKPALPSSGTFTANPISMIAGYVTLEMLDQSAIDRINGMGARLAHDLSAVFKRTRFPGQVTSFGSMFMIFGHQNKITDYRSAYSTPEQNRLVVDLQERLTGEGFYIARTGKGFLSTPMQDSDLDEFVLATERALKGAGN